MGTGRSVGSSMGIKGTEGRSRGAIRTGGHGGWRVRRLEAFCGSLLTEIQRVLLRFKRFLIILWLAQPSSLKQVFPISLQLPPLP
jgi:hypothetical protein